MDERLFLESFNAAANLITAALIAWVVREQKASARERERRKKRDEENGDA